MTELPFVGAFLKRWNCQVTYNLVLKTTSTWMSSLEIDKIFRAGIQ